MQNDSQFIRITKVSGGFLMSWKEFINKLLRKKMTQIIYCTLLAGGSGAAMTNNSPVRPKPNAS